MGLPSAGALRKLNGVGSASPGCSSNLLPVDGPAVEARWRAGLEAALAQAKLLQVLAEQDAGGLTGAAGGVLLLAAMNETVEEGAGRHDDGMRMNYAAIAQLHACNPA